MNSHRLFEIERSMRRGWHVIAIVICVLYEEGFRSDMDFIAESPDFPTLTSVSVRAACSARLGCVVKEVHIATNWLRELAGIYIMVWE
jgi:hypothetical protein